MGDAEDVGKGLSPQRRELLRLLLEERKKAGQKQAIPRRPEAESHPLSFAQERLWFLNQLEPDSPFYNVPSAVRLIGALNVAALDQALSEVVRRHEVLRTTFATVEGYPAQKIHPARPHALHVEDLRELPADERRARAERWVAEEGRRLFDLACGPLLRTRLLRLDAEEHLLLLTMHHIVSDGWSTGVIVKELASAYGAFARGLPSPLPELPVQYADFAVWQRAWLQGETLDSQYAYWKGRLGGQLPALELPTDRPRPAEQTYRGATLSSPIPAHVKASLQALARQEGVSLFMVLLAAFKVMLHRYTGQHDIVVGSPIAGRNREEVEQLIGFFANTLVLRTALSGDPTFREALARVREVALGAYAHQDLPFEKLVEALQPKRDLSRTPLFQVLFATQQEAAKVLELPGLQLELLEADSGTSKFDLSLDVIEGADSLRAVFEYNTDIFDGDTVRRMAAHYQILLGAAGARPDLRLSALPLLTPGEEQTRLRLEEEMAFDFAALSE